MKVTGMEERDVPAIGGRIQKGRVYDIKDTATAIDLIRQGIVKPYVDVLDGKDQPVHHVVHHTDGLELDSRLSSSEGE